jgi:hypothetical protein
VDVCVCVGVWAFGCVGEGVGVCVGGCGCVLCLVIWHSQA